DVCSSDLPYLYNLLRTFFRSTTIYFVSLESLDMTVFFHLVYIVDRDEYACFFYFTKLVIHRRAEGHHRRREVHVGIDQRRNVFAQFPYSFVQYFIAFFIIQPVEYAFTG